MITSRAMMHARPRPPARRERDGLPSTLAAWGRHTDVEPSAVDVAPVPAAGHAFGELAIVPESRTDGAEAELAEPMVPTAAERPLVQRAPDPNAPSTGAPPPPAGPDAPPGDPLQGGKAASGSTTITVSSSTRTVSAGTLSELWDVLTRSGTREAASVQPKLTPSPQYEYSDDDRVTKATVTVVEQKEMPAWQEADKQCPPIKNEWTRVLGVLDTHENKHIAIDKTHYADAHLKLVGKKREDAWAAMDAVVAAADAANQAYDTQSQNGAAEGAKLNTAVQCAPEKVKSHADTGEDKGIFSTIGEFVGGLMPKLTVGAVDDPLEREADAVAERVMRDESPSVRRAAAPSVQRCTGPGACECDRCKAEEEERRATATDGTVRRHAQADGASGGAFSDVALDRVDAALRGGGRALGAESRADMEMRFGHDFSRVRIHDDAPAAESATMVQARAYTLGSDIVFARGEYAPDTAPGRRLLAHELTHVVQQGMSAPVVRRDPKPGPAPAAPPTGAKQYSSKKVQEILALPASKVPDAIIGDRGSWLPNATVAEIRDLVTACLDSGQGNAGLAIDVCFHHYKNWQEVARSNVSLWKRCVLAMLETPDYFFKNKMDEFEMDTENVARGYLTMNEEYCAQQLTDMAYDRSGKPIIGPPSAEQDQARKNPVKVEKAQDLLDLQNQMLAAREVPVGYRKEKIQNQREGSGGGPGGEDEFEEKVVKFGDNTEQEPPIPPKPNDATFKSWKDVKKGYDAATEAIRDLVALHPKLYILVRDKFDDTSKTSKIVKDGVLTADATNVIAKELADTITNIGTTRGLMGKHVAKELKPIHEQLFAGRVTSPSKPNRNWGADPVWRAVAEAYATATGPKPWWHTLGLAAVEMGVYVIAGLATGGVAFAAAMLAKSAAEAAVAEGKKQAMQAAHGANTTPNTQLVTGKQVQEADVEAKMAIAFALLDAVMLGAEFKALGAAARAATIPGEQAVRAIDLSRQVLEYERQLLGTVSAADVAKSLERARVLTADAKKLAGEARAAANAATGDARLAARARMAEKAAERAEGAMKRMEGLQQASDTAAKAAPGVAKDSLVGKDVLEFRMPLADGGEMIVTKAGKVFVCQSPCWELAFKYADVIERNPTLKLRSKAVAAAEEEATKALRGLDKAKGEVVQRRLAKLSDAFREECERFVRAEKVVEWLRSEEALKAYPALKDAPLDASAIARILEKKTASGAKGQLLEELSGADIMAKLKTVEGRQQLGGQFAGEELIFVPGHMLRDPQGRQLTDGVIGFMDKGSFKIVSIVESKAGAMAAEGLRYGETEMRAVRSVQFKEFNKLRKTDPKAAAELRDMPVGDFVKAHKEQIEDAIRRAENADAEWRKVALEEYRDRVVKELRATGQADKAKEIPTELGKFEATLSPMEQAQVNQLMPLPEGGQFVRDIERGNEIGLQKLDPGKLPSIVNDGQVGSEWGAKAKVPTGTWVPTQFAGGRGSVRATGYVSADADAAGIAAKVAEGEGLATNINKVALSGSEMDTLARKIQDVGAEAKTKK